MVRTAEIATLLRLASVVTTVHRLKSKLQRTGAVLRNRFSSAGPQHQGTCWPNSKFSGAAVVVAQPEAAQLDVYGIGQSRTAATFRGSAATPAADTP